MFDADRPIQRSDQDRLNRSTFAKYLARCMLDHQDPGSLVVGLYGGWGVGKTSIINMAIEELQHASDNMLDAEKPIILNFSPWSYSGQDELIYNFFRRLSSALRGAPYLENADRIIYLLELYVSFFTHKPVPKSLRPKKTFLNKLPFFKKKEMYGWESGKDLTLIKAELNDLLRAQHHKIIIVIDNISRLFNYEIKQIFQIIKSMGDYANTVYLLSFDKTHVVNALDALDCGGGEEMVEKIVQLPFEVPPIFSQDIDGILADRLSPIVLMTPSDSWNMTHWADIYYGALKYFFKDCRDITRYVNTLHFSYQRLKDIVNPVDFFSLTAIEVFMPEIYFGIRDNKDLFTDLLDNVYTLDESQIKKDKARCDEIIARNNYLPSHITLALLSQLFPRLRKIYQPDMPFYHSDALARKLARICSPDLFDAYFRLSIQTGHILESEFNTLISLASDAKSFDQALTRLNQDGRATKFLDQLDGQALQVIPTEHIPAIINSLLDNGDLFPIGTPGLLCLDTPMRIHRIIHTLIQRFFQSEERFTLMKNAINNTNNSLYILVHELNEQTHEHIEDEDTFLPIEFRDFTPEQLESLRLLVIKRIEYWAEHGSLSEHPYLLPILIAWRDWGSGNKCQQYIESLTNTDRGLVAFITAALSDAVTQAMTKYKLDPSWDNNLNTISTFITPQSLEKRAVAIFEDPYFEKLREREQLALMIFLDLIKAKTKKIIPKTTA